MLLALSDVAEIAKAAGGVEPALIAACVAILTIVLAAAGLGLRLTYTSIRDLTTSNASTMDKVLSLVGSNVAHCEEEMKLAYQHAADSTAMFERTINRIVDAADKDRASREDMVDELRQHGPRRRKPEAGTGGDPK